MRGTVLIYRRASLAYIAIQALQLFSKVELRLGQSHTRMDFQVHGAASPRHHGHRALSMDTL